MNTIKNCLLFTFLVFSFSVFSQDFSLNWSERMQYSNNKDGFFTSFLNTNDKYVYTINSNYALRPKKKDDKIKLIAYDKKTMKQKASVALRGYKENAGSKATYASLDYHKTIIFKDEVLVFWIKKTNTKSEKKEDLYVESFTSELKRSKKLKKIYSSNLPTDVKISRFAGSSIIVEANDEAGEELIIGAELPQKGDNVVFKYLIMNTDLEASEETEIELPIKLTGKSYGLSSVYEYGKDGNIYVQSVISLTKEERKNAEKGEDLAYCVFSIINTTTGDVSTFELKDENKTINDFEYVITANNVKIYGFFGDLEKDPSGNSTHGLFFSQIDSKTLEDNGMNYTYFDKETIDKLFAKDKEDKKKSSAFSKKKRNAAAENDAEALDVRFGIENMFVTDDNNIVLFCAKMYNYSVTTCTTNSSGGTTCTTRYYCEKSNVTAIRVNNEGEIIWASNVDRKMTYSGTSIYDVKTVFQNDKFYVIYGSAYDVDAEKKNRKSRKKLSEYRDNFEYATFDYESGDFKKNTFMVNKKDVEKKERKAVNPVSIVVLEDKFYVNYMVVRQKIGWCVANVICFPTLYYSMLSGDTKSGYGNLGVIVPLK